MADSRRPEVRQASFVEGEQPLISAVIKAKDEARHIADCINSLRGFAQEIIVVDDESEDGTAEIARRLGARVIAASSAGESVNILDKIGFRAARGRWILRIDADERMSPALAERLAAVAREGRYAGVRFARKNIIFGGWVRHAGLFRSNQLRFFRADAWDPSWAGETHGHPPISGEVLTLPCREELATLHLNHDTVAEFIERYMVKYSAGEARVLRGKGKRFSLLRFIFRPLRRFLSHFVLRCGFRDGARGLVLAGLMAAADLCTEAQLWDMERREGPPPCPQGKARAPAESARHGDTGFGE